jgi:hypothetical protein
MGVNGVVSQGESTAKVIMEGTTTFHNIQTFGIFKVRMTSNGRKGGDVTATTLFDAVHEGTVRNLYALSKWDSSGASPYLNVTRGLAAEYPSLVGQKKVQLATFFYEHILGKGPVPEGKTVVPLNYKPFDIREANLILLDGESGKANKSPKTLEMPEAIADDPAFEQYEATFRYMPRGVTMPSDGARGFKFQFGKGSLSSGTPSISAPTRGVCAAFIDKVLPTMRDNDPNFDATNAVYQDMVRTYEAAMIAE